MAWSTSNPSSIDKSGATIDGNTIITYLKEKNENQIKLTQVLVILWILIIYIKNNFYILYLPILMFSQKYFYD